MTPCCVIGSGGVIKASQTSCLLSRPSWSHLVLVALLPWGTILFRMWTAATPRLVVLAASSPGGEAAELSGSKTFMGGIISPVRKLHFYCFTPASGCPVQKCSLNCEHLENREDLENLEDLEHLEDLENQEHMENLEDLENLGTWKIWRTWKTWGPGKS